MTEPLSKLIEEIDALEKKATPGPWRVETVKGATEDGHPIECDWDSIVGGDDDIIELADVHGDNVALVNALRNSWPKLRAALSPAGEMPDTFTSDGFDGGACCYREECAAVRAHALSLAGRVAHDAHAYRGALGYAIPGEHDGRLSDGTTPINGLVASVVRLRAEPAEQRALAAEAALASAREEIKGLKAELLVRVDHHESELARLRASSSGERAVDEKGGNSGNK